MAKRDDEWVSITHIQIKLPFAYTYNRSLISHYVSTGFHNKNFFGLSVKNCLQLIQKIDDQIVQNSLSDAKSQVEGTGGRPDGGKHQHVVEAILVMSELSFDLGILQSLPVDEAVIPCHVISGRYYVRHGRHVPEVLVICH